MLLISIRVAWFKRLVALRLTSRLLERTAAASFPNSGRLFAQVLGSASDLYPCGLVQVSRCIQAYLEALRENGLKPVLGENASH